MGDGEFKIEFVEKMLDSLADKKQCRHEDNQVIQELNNGYFLLKCNDCKAEFYDG